jgi:excisionase family DNA binding protein
MICCMSLIDVQRRLLTIDEVAQRLGVSRRTVQRKIAAGELPALGLGGRRSPVRIDEAELEAWLYAAPQEAA